MANGMRFFFTALVRGQTVVKSGHFDIPLPYPDAKPPNDILRMIEEMLERVGVGDTPHIHEWKYLAAVEQPVIIFTAEKVIPNARNSCRPN